VTGVEVGPHQFFFASEGVVERRLGHAGVFDDSVDADGLDPSVVEEFVGGVEQPFREPSAAVRPSPVQWCPSAFTVLFPKCVLTVRSFGRLQ